MTTYRIEPGLRGPAGQSGRGVASISGVTAGANFYHRFTLTDGTIYTVSVPLTGGGAGGGASDWSEISNIPAVVAGLSAMPEVEAVTGTATAARAVSAAVLKAAVEAHGSGGGGSSSWGDISDKPAFIGAGASAAAARDAIGAAPASTTVSTSGAQSIDGVKTFTTAPVVPDDAFAIAKVSGLQEELDALQTQTAIFVDDIEDIPPGTPVDTLVVVRAGA